MTGTEDSDRYLLGAEDDSFQRYRLFNEIYQPGTAERLATLGISPDMDILEVGCGIGDTACYMATHLVPKGHVTTFDQAPDLVERAKRQAADAGIENITILCVKADDFPYEPNRWNLAHTRYVLSYLSDADAIIRKIFGALKPSGVFLGEEIAQHYIKHGRTEWYDAMAGWFSKLIEAGGGNPNYGIAQLPSDMLTAGFVDLKATAYWPVEDQTKIRDVLRLALSREMKQNIVGLGLATAEDVDAVVAALGRPAVDDVISASMAVQIIGRKPSR